MPARLYLNGHRAEATADLELTRRMAWSHHGQEHADQLGRFAIEIAHNRSAPLAIVASLGGTVRVYMVGGPGWEPGSERNSQIDRDLRCEWDARSRTMRGREPDIRPGAGRAA